MEGELGWMKRRATTIIHTETRASPSGGTRKAASGREQVFRPPGDTGIFTSLERKEVKHQPKIIAEGFCALGDMVEKVWGGEETRNDAGRAGG